MLYVAVFLILGIFSLMDIIYLERNVRRFFFVVATCILFLLGAFRWETGTDWIPYLEFFQRNFSFDEFNNGLFEIGYVALNFLVKSFTEKYTVFLVVLACITIGFKSFFFYRYTGFFLTALFTFYAFFLGDIFAVRQSIAISFTLWSTKFIAERKFLLFILMLAMATLFHVTAPVFLIAYFIFKKVYSSKFVYWVLFASIIISYTGIVTKALELLGGLGGEGLVMLKLLAYLDSPETNNSEISTGLLLLLGYARRIVLIPVLLYYRRQASLSSKYYNGCLNIFIFGNILYFLFSNSIAVFIRASSYFLIYEVILVSILLQSFQNRVKRYLVFCILFLYAAAKLYFALSTYKDLYIPYYSIFDNYIPRQNF
jgi:hypothetical protein